MINFLHTVAGQVPAGWHKSALGLLAVVQSVLCQTDAGQDPAGIQGPD